MFAEYFLRLKRNIRRAIPLQTILTQSHLLGNQLFLSEGIYLAAADFTSGSVNADCQNISHTRKYLEDYSFA